MTIRWSVAAGVTLLAVTLFPSLPFAAPRHWPWLAPVNLGAPINRRP
jgi:hypothetical protein